MERIVADGIQTGGEGDSCKVRAFFECSIFDVRNGTRNVKFC